MLARVQNLPLFVILIAMAGVAMTVPAFHAMAVGDEARYRVFFHSGILTLVLAAMLGLATASREAGNLARSHLTTLVGTFLGLPLLLALPLRLAVEDLSLFDAYFEMVSCLTTTGATLFDAPQDLPGSVHLWRALVGWLGGLFVLVTAVSILAPMNLGGFEVLAPLESETRVLPIEIEGDLADPRRRLQRFLVRIFPVYGGLTLVLWVLLIAAGDRPFVAAVHAMSTLSTSGISSIGGMEYANSGIAGELAVFVFLFFALSRRLMLTEGNVRRLPPIFQDAEFGLALLCIAAVAVLLFGRHWIGAYAVDAADSPASGIQALWGSVFTALSFLSTTGFESHSWGQAIDWSGLKAPGMVLMGLCLVGGGVATTAGGVKLLRVYALYRHGERELQRLVHPSSVGGAGAAARSLRRRGAHIAWISFMLFAIALSVVSLALALTGLDFTTSLTLAIAALSTTGPVAQATGDAVTAYAALGGAAKAILVGAMVLGRLETLAIVALFNPDFWRG